MFVIFETHLTMFLLFARSVLAFFFCVFLLKKPVGPPGAQPHQPIATFHRYQSPLHAAQAQIDLRNLEIPGLTVRPLRTSVAPVKAVKAQPFKIQAEGGSAVNIPKPRLLLQPHGLPKAKLAKLLLQVKYMFLLQVLPVLAPFRSVLCMFLEEFVLSHRQRWPISLLM